MRSDTSALLAVTGFCVSKCVSLFNSGIFCLACYSTSLYSTCSRLVVVFGGNTFQKPHLKCGVQKQAFAEGHQGTLCLLLR